MCLYGANVMQASTHLPCPPGKQLDAVDKEHVSPVGRCPPPPTPPVKPRPPQALKSFLPPPPRPSLVTRPPLPEAISQATPTGTPEEAAVDSTVVDGNEERGDDHRQGLGKRSLGAIKLKLKQQVTHSFSVPHTLKWLPHYSFYLLLFSPASRRPSLRLQPTEC